MSIKHCLGNKRVFRWLPGNLGKDGIAFSFSQSIRFQCQQRCRM